MKTNPKKFTRTPSDIFPAGVCELTVGYTRKKLKRMKVTGAEEVAEYLRTEIFPEGSLEYSERFYVLFLDRSNSIFCYKELSCGGISGTVADIRLIFQTALLVHASFIIICHNHPSGSTKPSQADIQLTRKIKEAGELLDIRVLDHIILADDFYSFANEGLV